MSRTRLVATITYTMNPEVPFCSRLKTYAKRSASHETIRLTSEPLRWQRSESSVPAYCLSHRKRLLLNMSIARGMRDTSLRYSCFCHGSAVSMSSDRGDVSSGQALLTVKLSVLAHLLSIDSFPASQLNGADTLERSQIRTDVLRLHTLLVSALQ